MENDFTISTKIDRPIGDVFFAITTDVAKWWGGADFSGTSTDLNDEFIIHHPGAHYSKQKLIEVIPDKKVVWLVTESELSWLERDKQEWTNTKMIFELTAEGGKTLLQFTHQSLTPEMGSYERCSQGWAMVITEWLCNFVTAGITM